MIPCVVEVVAERAVIVVADVAANAQNVVNRVDIYINNYKADKQFQIELNFTSQPYLTQLEIGWVNNFKDLPSE